MAFKPENDIVKTPHQTMLYTTHQLQEFAKCADPVTGPAYFMSHYFYIQTVKSGSAVYKPYDYQKGLLDTYHGYRNSVALLPRQSGKCCFFTTLIKIKQKSTGQEYELPIGIYHEFIKAKKDGTPLPDISQFCK